MPAVLYDTNHRTDQVASTAATPGIDAQPNTRSIDSLDLQFSDRHTASKSVGGAQYKPDETDQA